MSLNKNIASLLNAELENIPSSLNMNELAGLIEQRIEEMKKAARAEMTKDNIDEVNDVYGYLIDGLAMIKREAEHLVDIRNKNRVFVPLAPGHEAINVAGGCIGEVIWMDTHKPGLRGKPWARSAEACQLGRRFAVGYGTKKEAVLRVNHEDIKFVMTWNLFEYLAIEKRIEASGESLASLYRAEPARFKFMKRLPGQR